MDQAFCNERHNRIDARLKEHDDKLEALTKSNERHSEAIQNLCDKIENLVTTIKWLIGLVIVPILTGIFGFFFYALQSKILH